MPAWKLLLLLLVATILGCSSRDILPRPSAGSLACRIVATSAGHPALVAAAEIETGNLVKRNDEIIGEWLPVADPSLAASNVDAIANAVLRTSEKGREILVAVSQHDITDKDVAGIHAGEFDLNGRPVLTLTLTKTGSKSFFKFTGDNAQRYLAIIVGGAVQSVPQIQAPIGQQFIIVSPTQAESDKLATVLTAS